MPCAYGVRMNIVATALIDVVSLPLCLFAVDAVTGVVHWAEDTWTAPGRNALLDRWIVTDNIEHHRAPGAIRAGDYWATNRVCIIGATGFAATLAACGVHAWQPYLIALLGSQANQVHLWAHSANPPRVVALLQSYGVLQSRRQHAQHHKRPYLARYCAFTNYLNPLLDRVDFWRTAERAIEHCGARVQRASVARDGF